MKLTNAQINNFRLLENVVINIDKTTTSIVGKNNTGKTSFSKLFDIFINDKGFSFDDFSLKTHPVFRWIYKIHNRIDDDNREKITDWIRSKIPKISLLLTIEIDTSDNWSNIRPFNVGLSTDNEIKILFEYKPDNTDKLLTAIKEKIDKYSSNGIETEPVDIFRQEFSDYYKTVIQPFSETETTSPVSLKEVQNLIQSSFIYAQRAVEDSHSDKASKLSNVFEHQYKNKKRDDEDLTKDLTTTVDNTSNEINQKLKVFFNDFITSFAQFGFPNIDNEELELKSDLKVEKLFKNDVKLYYKHGQNILPENYNGLGYSNLIYIISKIIGFQEIYNESKASLCLIFIEEPEAHMHPQMQSVFISKINNFLTTRGFNVQVILTTHSSHILINSTFESIRYFTTKKRNTVIKDLKNFNPSINKEETLQFLQQYLTLGKADLFFADKAILFEGVVERLLMPIFIKKVDEIKSTKLSESYISYIEVGGAYAHNFKELLEFLEIKTLIITDIDSVALTTGSRPTKAKISDDADLLTSNPVLKSWLPNEENIKKLLFNSSDKKEVNNIRVAYQTNFHETEVKCGRTFEEAYVIDNSEYIFNNKINLKSIKYVLKGYSTIEEVFNNSYEIYDFIDRNNKKTDFAFDLLTYNQDKWKTPTYIEEGLGWLAK